MNKKDKILFRILNQFGKSDLEAQIQHSSQVFSTLKQPPETFTIFGYYDLNHKTFNWLNGMNEIMQRFISEGYQSVFGSDKSWKKLFQSSVRLQSNDKNVIPYLMEIINAKYNVIRFITSQYEIYALVSLPNTKETFSFEEFNSAMFLYRFDKKMEEKYGSKRHTRKRPRYA